MNFIKDQHAGFNTLKALFISGFIVLSPVASCQLPVASCQLPVASCQLPVASAGVVFDWIDNVYTLGDHRKGSIDVGKCTLTKPAGKADSKDQ